MAMGWLLLAGSTRAAGPEVMVLPTTGIVDGSMAKYLEDSITLAEERNVAAVVIKLNTPGGRLDSTNDIVGSILEAQVPVIVWVAPAGGFAASAGTFITLAGNLALMAPGTSIGAASPISGDGEDIDGTLGQKVLNDAIAKITSIANARDRNVEWAVGTVRDAKSSPAEEAVAVGAVDGIAATIEEVLAFADGKTVEVRGQPVTLELTGATASEQAMNPFLAIIRLLSDPTIALLLLSTGSAGLLAELYSQALEARGADVERAFRLGPRELLVPAMAAGLIEMIPGLGGAAKQAQQAIDRGELARVEAILRSMTPQERNDPAILNGSRRRRIARGSGTSLQEVNRLIKQFGEMQRLMRQMQARGGRWPLRGIGPS